MVCGRVTVLVCLHAWGAHEHPPLTSAEVAAPGNGLLLFFRVDDYDGALSRARASGATLAEEPHRNPNTGTLEFSLRDSDGYYVTIGAPWPVLSAPKFFATAAAFPCLARSSRRRDDRAGRRLLEKSPAGSRR
ncbi:MAG: hypothetical protein U0P30_14360 [Vicinamibacterales bacterium]